MQKRIGFLSFGHWQPIPGSQAQDVGDEGRAHGVEYKPKRGVRQEGEGEENERTFRAGLCIAK